MKRTFVPVWGLCCVRARAIAEAVWVSWIADEVGM